MHCTHLFISSTYLFKMTFVTTNLNSFHILSPHLTNQHRINESIEVEYHQQCSLIEKCAIIKLYLCKLSICPITSSTYDSKKRTNAFLFVRSNAQIFQRSKVEEILNAFHRCQVRKNEFSAHVYLLANLWLVRYGSNFLDVKEVKAQIGKALLPQLFVYLHCDILCKRKNRLI